MCGDRRNWLRDRWYLDSEALFLQLLQAYSSGDRYYHTVEHLYQVLNLIEQLDPAVSITLNLAAWFHDAVYDTHAQDNEEKSAELAEMALSELPAETIAQVRKLILCTKTHQAFDAESELLLDADLAILSAEPTQYQNYAIAIRQEYRWVSAEDYRIGRSQVLERFLQRDRIYYTPMMQAKETIARRNLDTELQNLRCAKHD
jgi:predicted metal-dependent HD superfamily phosphohydrolase